MLPPHLMLAITKCSAGRFGHLSLFSPRFAPGAAGRVSDFGFRILFIAGLLAFMICISGCTPPGPRALLKGQRLIQQGKYAQAVQSLQEATRLLPKNAQAYNHLGLALQGNKQFGSALAAYKKAL